MQLSDETGLFSLVEQLVSYQVSQVGSLKCFVDGALANRWHPIEERKAHDTIAVRPLKNILRIVHSRCQMRIRRE